MGQDAMKLVFLMLSPPYSLVLAALSLEDSQLAIFNWDKI